MRVLFTTSEYARWLDYSFGATPTTNHNGTFRSRNWNTECGESRLPVTHNQWVIRANGPLGGIGRL